MPDGLIHLHRPLSLLVLGVSLFIWFQAKKKNESTKMPVWILAGVGGQILLGIILAYAGLPPWSQTAHLVLGAGLLCLVYRAGYTPSVPSGMGKRIVAMGDGLWDLFRMDPVSEEPLPTMPCHASILGGEVFMVSGVGKDDRGHALLEVYQKHGVKLRS